MLKLMNLTKFISLYVHILCNGNIACHVSLLNQPPLSIISPYTLVTTTMVVAKFSSPRPVLVERTFCPWLEVVSFSWSAFSSALGSNISTNSYSTRFRSSYDLSTLFTTMLHQSHFSSLKIGMNSAKKKNKLVKKKKKHSILCFSLVPKTCIHSISNGPGPHFSFNSQINQKWLWYQICVVP